MIELARGCELSGWDDADWLFHEGKIAGFKPIFPDGSIDWSPLHRFGVQAFQSCVAWDLCQKVYLTSMLHDPTPIVFPSPLYTYQRTVRVGREDRSFVDEGSSCRLAMKVSRDTGFVPDTDWPEDPERLFEVPPAHLYQDGVLATLEAFYRIPDGPMTLARGMPKPSVQIDASMRRGYPVGCVLEVNQAFAELGKKTWTGPIIDGTPAGYHAQTIIARDKPGRRFGLASTWGAELGDDGIFWISDDALDEYAAEFWVVQHAPGDL